MPRQVTEPLTKHTLLLREGDYDQLRQRFIKLGAGPVIRRLVSDAVDKLNKPLTKRELNTLLTDEELSNDQPLQDSDRSSSMSGQPPEQVQPEPIKPRKRKAG